MDISNNLNSKNYIIKNNATSFNKSKKTDWVKKESIEKTNYNLSMNDLFIQESRDEFLKKLKSKNSLPFLTQLLYQKNGIFSEKPNSIANNAYTKSNKISDLIYGNLEYIQFFA